MCRFGGTCLLLLLCFVGDVATKNNELSLSELREQNNGLDATRQDLDFLVRPNMTQWEQLLLPAPTVVSLLGQMVVLSSKIDVSLEGVRPKDGWLFVQNPQSLRACLIQIGHKAWDAFRIAQRNMDEIQLTMGIVPKHLQSAIKIIKTMSPRMIGILLPKTLDRISQSAIISENLIVTTETAFINVMGLTEEIERSVATTQGIVDQNITANNAQISYTDKLLDKMNETAQMAKKQYNTISSEVEKARQAYEKAVKDIPTGWEALVMDVVRSVSSIVKNLATSSFGIGSLFGGGGQGGGSGGQSGSTAGSSSQVNAAAVKDVIILNAATIIQSKLSELQSAFGSIADWPADRFTGLKVELQTFLNIFAEYPNTAIKQSANSVYGECISILQSLETAAQGTTPMSDEEKAALKTRIDAAVSKGKELTAGAGEAGSAMTTTNSGTAGGKEGNSDYDNEKFIVNVRQNQLQQAENRLDASFDRLFALNREMAQIEADLAALDITKINLQDIRTLLSKVIKILGKIREQWDSLIEFFQLVAVRTTVINRDIIRPFLSDTTDLTQNMDASERDAILSHILDLAVDVNSASFFLHTIAKTYVDVSHTYLLQKLAGLSQLLGAESDDERTRLRGEIEANAESAREGIHVLIQGLRDTYKKKLEERKQQLKQYEQSLSSAIGTSDEGEDAAAIEKGRQIAQTVGVVLPDGAVRIL